MTKYKEIQFNKSISHKNKYYIVTKLCDNAEQFYGIFYE